jgi:hypothetical protein
MSLTFGGVFARTRVQDESRIRLGSVDDSDDEEHVTGKKVVPGTSEMHEVAIGSVSLLCVDRASSWQDDAKGQMCTSAHWQRLAADLPQAEEALAAMVERSRYICAQKAMKGTPLGRHIARGTPPKSREQGGGGRGEIVLSEAELQQLDELSLSQLHELVEEARASMPPEADAHIPETVANWGGGEEGGWMRVATDASLASAASREAANLAAGADAAHAEAELARRRAVEDLEAATAELKEAKAMAADNVTEIKGKVEAMQVTLEQAEQLVADKRQAAEEARERWEAASSKAADCQVAVAESRQRRAGSWTKRRVLLQPGGRQCMRLLVCPHLEKQQMIVSLTWNPAYAILLRMTILTPWGKRVSHINTQSVSEEMYSIDLNGEQTGPKGSFQIESQPRCVLGLDDAMLGGPVLASCWSHSSSGNFKISVSLSNKGPTKAEQDLAKASATPNREVFYRTSHFNNNYVEKAAGPGAGRVPKDLQDSRLQIRLTVFSHNGGVQTFSPAQEDGFFRRCVCLCVQLCARAFAFSTLQITKRSALILAHTLVHTHKTST